MDEHLADQLVIYAAIADGLSSYRAPSVTGHLSANVWVTNQFLSGAAAIRDDGVVSATGRCPRS